MDVLALAVWAVKHATAVVRDEFAAGVEIVPGQHHHFRGDARRGSGSEHARGSVGIAPLLRGGGFAVIIIVIDQNGADALAAVTLISAKIEKRIRRCIVVFVQRYGHR